MKHYYFTFNDNKYIVYYHSSLKLPSTKLSSDITYSKLKDPIVIYSGSINKVPEFNREVKSEIMDFSHYIDSSKSSSIFEYNLNSESNITIVKYDS